MNTSRDLRDWPAAKPRIFVVGSVNMDLVIRVPRLPNAGETLGGSDLEFHPGGKGANQACTAAKLGGDAILLGAIGRDAFGAQLLQSLERAGVDTSRVQGSDRPSGCASIYVEASGENAIVISPGANAEVTPEYVRDSMPDLTARDFVLLQLEIPMESVQSALKIAASVGATSILDPAPARFLDRPTLELVKILTPNQNEAKVLLNALVESGKDDELASIVMKCLRLGPETVILKLGKHGCAICSENLETKVEAHVVEVVDTTAAGDVFNGALAVALAEEQSLLSAARFANAAAALSVTRRGAQTSIPSRNEVNCARGRWDFEQASEQR